MTKTHSRPYTATDNPYSEAQFRTLKYRPEFPDRFGCLPHARRFCGPFLDWYNTEHRHSGLAMLTPHDVHYGLAEQRLAKRTAVLATAYAAHPERFPHGVPTPGRLPQAVWINQPAECGCAEKNDFGECPRIGYLDGPRGNSAPEFGVIRPSEEEMLLAIAY